MVRTHISLYQKTINLRYFITFSRGAPLEFLLEIKRWKILALFNSEGDIFLPLGRTFAFSADKLKQGLTSSEPRLILFPRLSVTAL